jgi:hypothetical protein
VKRLLISGMVALLVALMVTMAAQAAPPQPLDFEKECSSFPPTCTIQNSSLPILEGATLTYLGPVLGNPHGFIISSEVLLELDVGTGTAMGHFTFVLDHGYFTFRRGTGDLAGFHAQGEIGTPVGVVFPMEGTYHFKP